MSTPNWGNLVRQGRAKAIGIPWSDVEAHARFILQIPAEYVRDGIVTLEDYEAAKTKEAKDGVPLERKSKADLQKQAKAEGIEFTPDAPPEALVKVLSKKGKK